MRFSRYIAKRIFSALNACIHKLWNILFHSVPARDRKNLVLEVQCKHSDCLFHQSSENWIPSILWSLVKPVLRKFASFVGERLKNIVVWQSQTLYFSIWQPPTLPHRLQCSTIGRLGLNHRVRDGYGCYPQAHRHQKCYQFFWQNL